MKKIPLVLLALVLTGCAARMTQAEFFGDPRDSLTVQREHPKMFARPATPVGAMRTHFRDCQAGSKHLQKLVEVQQPITKGISGEALLDVVTLGTHSLSLQKEGYAEAAECMKAMGYTRR